MKQLCKRLIAIFCALMLVSGSIFTANVLQAEADTNELFSEDFNSYGDNASGAANKDAMIAKGWGLGAGDINNTIGNFNRGSYYRIPYNGTNGNMPTPTLITSGVDGASEWTDYSVEATMKYEYEDGMSGGTTAGIGGRMSGENGYFLEAVKSSTIAKGGKIRIRRDTTTLTSAEYSVSTMKLNEEFTLKLEFKDTVLYGYYNGECVITYDTKDDATKYSKGCAGFRKKTATGCNVIWDDFLVTQEVADEPMVYPEGYFYYNDFSSDKDLKKEGWAGSGTKENQAYQLPAGGAAYITGVSGSSEWTDYIVEADVTLLSGAATEGYASIVARSTDTTKTGYEYRMVYADGNTSLVLYKRAAKNVILATYDMDFALDTPYKMSMAVCGDNIMCWFGDIYVFDYVDSTDPYLTGYTGVRSPGAATNLNSVYDNYAVREYEEPIVVYPEGYYYYNDFETPRNLKKDGWTSDGTKENGVYVLNAATANYLRDMEGSLEWTDYVVEADMMINDDGSETQYASIVGRSTDTTKNGYEYRLTKDATGTYVTLFKRGISGGKINNLEHKFNISVIPGEMNHMKMVLNGSTITCYFNGIKLLEVTDAEAYLNGYAGVRSPAGTATSSYDNYAVREIRDTDIVTEGQLQKQDGSTWFYDDFTADSSFTERGWDTDDVELYNSAVNLNGRLAVEGIEGADKWSDYQVEAIVTVDKNAGLLEGQTIGWAAVCSRTTSKTTGYEFGIITPSSSAAYLRLYDRAKDENIAVDKTIVIDEGEHKLTMACVGNVITCYYDGTLVFTAQNNSASAGTAALRSSGYPTYYKSISVGEVTAVNVVLPPAEGDVVVSPATGDWSGSMETIPLVIFVISTLGLMVTLGYKKKYEV